MCASLRVGERTLLSRRLTISADLVRVGVASIATPPRSVQLMAAAVSLSLAMASARSRARALENGEKKFLRDASAAARMQKQAKATAA